MKVNEIRYIDLFSGAGGLSLGFEKLSKHPFKAVWANDFNKDAAATYEKNFGIPCSSDDLVDLLESGLELPQADLVIGGPPCQGFSLLNKKREDDPRKKLWIPFMEVVDQCGADTFVMENVPQLLKSLEYEEIVQWANNKGFKVWAGVLMAADYGVPQIRKRAFIVGSKSDDPVNFFPPKKTHFNPAKLEPKQFGYFRNDYVLKPKPWETVKDAIMDLPKPVGTEIRHGEGHLDLQFGRNPTAKSIKRYKAIPGEGMNRFDLERIAPEITPECWKRKKSGGTDLFGRLWWDRPAFTIRTEFFKPEKGRFLHPEQHRPITHREAARFQTFPDDFKFFGTKIEIARQIGNAVPPLLAAQVAKSVAKLILQKNSEQKIYTEYVSLSDPIIIDEKG